MTQTYPLILLNGHAHAVEHEAEIEDGGWCFEIHEDYEDPRPKFKDKNNPKLAWWLRELNMSYRKKGYKNPEGELEFHRIMDGSCIKVTLSSDPSLNLPLLPPIEEDVQIPKFVPKNGHKSTVEEAVAHMIGFTQGYKVAKAKYQDKPPVQVELEIIGNEVIVHKWIYE